MAEIRLHQVTNRFLKNIDLEAADGSLFAVVGPSGAGENQFAAGRGRAGRSPGPGLDRRPGSSATCRPHLREIGYVTQDLNLFPHLTLEGNLFLAMNRSGWTRAQRRKTADELMDLLRIRPLARRKPGTMSGGEKQRAALARVLASRPKVLLLDEPFGKLDFRTARYLRVEFKNLHQELGLTAILVTHNLEEADFLADTIAVMRAGALWWEKAPDYEHGKDVASEDSFLERPNLLSCRVVRTLESGVVEVEWAGGLLLIPDEGRPFSRFSVKRRNIELDASPPPGPSINRFSGKIVNLIFGDDSVRVTVAVNGESLFVEMAHHRWEQIALNPGDPVHGLLRLKSLDIV